MSDGESDEEKLGQDESDDEKLAHDSGTDFRKHPPLPHLYVPCEHHFRFFYIVSFASSFLCRFFGFSLVFLCNF